MEWGVKGHQTSTLHRPRAGVDTQGLLPRALCPCFPQSRRQGRHFGLSLLHLMDGTPEEGVAKLHTHRSELALGVPLLLLPEWLLWLASRPIILNRST